MLILQRRKEKYYCNNFNEKPYLKPLLDDNVRESIPKIFTQL